MFSLDLRRFGEFLATLPEPTLRAFGDTPYLRRVPVARLEAEAIVGRCGSVHCWVLRGRAAGWLPLAIYLEVRTFPGYAVRAGWLRGRGRMLRDELFPPASLSWSDGE